jgi:XTP/dITP diphosphohydrolase
MNRNRILFATNNDHKVNEINDILQKKGSSLELVTMKSLGIHEDIPETGKTLEENALIKCKFLHQLYPDMPIIAEDTGLEVNTLDNAPGVHTARYAGEDKNPEHNMDKLLSALLNHSDRSARFRTVLAYIGPDQEQLFEGIVVGKIADKKTGKGGFGYDPIFIPDGYQQSFAELGKEIKSTISHRAKAVEKLIEFLQAKFSTRN